MFIELKSQIKEILFSARMKVSKIINNELLLTYWQIGKAIVEKEKEHNFSDQTIRQIILQISKELSGEIGKGFSRSNLFNMRSFYLSYSDVQTLSGHLSWSHYCELLSISDNYKKAFYEKECLNSSWSVRELKRQIDSSYFERILLSSGNVNKEKVREMALAGNVINNPSDIIKDPYVFEFLGIPENKPLLEKDLEKKLIRHLEEFLLELGRGFMYVGSQKRITLNNTHCYVDMVFYNKVLKAYVLIDLKMGKLKPENIGQMNMYLNYYKNEVNDDSDNDPIGIVLCADKDAVAAEYALGGLNNQIFASTYVYYIPNKDQLIREVELILSEASDEK